MGTHPIFESDFDCLTDKLKCTGHQDQQDHQQQLVELQQQQNLKSQSLHQQSVLLFVLKIKKLLQLKLSKLELTSLLQQTSFWRISKLLVTVTSAYLAWHQLVLSQNHEENHGTTTQKLTNKHQSNTDYKILN